MLQRIEAEVCQIRRFGMPVDGKHSALVMEFVKHEIW
jgi:hypothetical protein